MPQPRQANEILKSREIPEEPAFYKHTLEDTKTSERRERAREEGLTRSMINGEQGTGHRYAYVEGNMRWKNPLHP